MNERFPSRRATAANVRARRAPVLERLEHRHLMAGWSPVGPETLVNDTTAGVQETTYEGHKAIASDDNGRYAVVWSGSGTTDPDGIYARLYDASGALGPSFRVNSTTAGVQTEAAVAMDDAGDFVVVWSSSAQDGAGWGVYGQRYNAAGVPQGGEFRVNLTTNGDQYQPSVAMDSDGDFVVTWTSSVIDGNNNGLGIAAQRFNAAGALQGGEVRINGYVIGDQLHSAVAMDDLGNYNVVYQSYFQLTGNTGIFLQRYTAVGGAIGSWSVVNATTGGFQLAPAIGMNGSGQFVVAWTSDAQDTSGRGIYAQRYTAAGTKTGGEFPVNATITGDQQYPSVAVDTTGAFVIAWESAAQDASGWGAYAREYTAAGVSIGAEFRLNSTTAGDQHDVAVAMVGNGDYVSVWSGAGTGDADGVFLQRYENLLPGVTVTPTTGLVTNESGATATFTVVLDSRPTANVTISLTSSDTTEGSVSPGTLTFTRSNWRVPQTVTVTGVNDAFNDGAIVYTIQTGTATSGDADYGGRAVADVSVTNIDTTPPPNAPPTIATTGTALQYVEGSGAVAVDAGVTLTDSNNSDLVGAAVSVVGYVGGQDVLAFAGAGAITAAWNAATGTLTLSGVASVAAYQAALRAVTYQNTSDNPSLVTRSVRFVVNDGEADSAPASRSIAISAINDPPVAADETYAAVQDTALSVGAAAGVLANDTDVDGSSLSAVLLQQAANGTVQLFANGRFTYTPVAGFWGTDQFTYTVSDGAGGSDTATVTVQVARGPGVTVTPTSGLVTTASGGWASFTVVLNTAPSANVRINLSSSDPTEGAVSVPSVTFTPANWNTPQTVVVSGVNDGMNEGNVAYTVVTSAAVSGDAGYNGLAVPDVSVVNRPGNVSPVALDDSFAVISGEVLAVASPGVLANDSDADGDALAVSLVTGPLHGTINLKADGSFTYTPAAGFVGTDTVVYRAADGLGGTDGGTITIDVTPRAGITVSPATGLTTNESGGAATFTVVLTRRPTAAVRIELGATVAGEGALSATTLLFDDTNWNLPQTVTVTGADDGIDDGDRVYTVTLAAAASLDPLYDGLDASDVVVTNVQPPRQAPADPTARPDSYRVTRGETLSVAPAGVLRNDSSTEGVPLTAALVEQAEHGVVVLSTDGGFVYTPAPGFVGTDRFTYSASDAAGTDSAEVRIVVEAEDRDDPPIVPPPVTPLPMPPDGTDGEDEAEEDAPPRDDVPVIEITPRVPIQPAGDDSPLAEVPSDPPAKGGLRPAPAARGPVAAVPLQPLVVHRAASQEQSAEGSEATDEPSGDEPGRGGAGRVPVIHRVASVAATPPAALVSAVGPLATKLEAMNRQLGAADASQSATIRSVSQVALAMTAGYVMWSLRGASLLASLVTSLPLWRSLDPLPILEARADREKAKAAAKRRKAAGRKRGSKAPQDRSDDDDKLGSLVN